MNTKFSLSIILTIGAFVLTLYLFGVCVLAYNDMATLYYPGCGTTVTAIPAPQEANLDHPGAKLFAANCKACHRINQKLVGPALAGATERYDSLWLKQWIRNSAKMIADGDPLAVALYQEYNQTQMTAFTSFTDKELKELLEYLALASKPDNQPVVKPKVEI